MPHATNLFAAPLPDGAVLRLAVPRGLVAASVKQMNRAGPPPGVEPPCNSGHH